MKRLKRRIIAIFTALVMVLALVVSFVPADVKADNTENWYINTDGSKSESFTPNTIVIVHVYKNTNIDYSVDSDNKVITFNELNAIDLYIRSDYFEATNWTFVFNGTNRLGHNFYLKKKINIKVNAGGSLYVFHMILSDDSIPTLVETKADKTFEVTSILGVTFTPDITISSISPTVTVPAGTKTFEYETEHMGYISVKPEDGAGYTVQSTDIVKTIDGDSYSDEDYPLTLEEGKEYYALVLLDHKDGYKFAHNDSYAPQVNITPQGEDTSLGKALYADDGQLKFTVKFKVPKKEPTPPSPIPPTPTQHKFLNGDNQVVTYGQPVMFRLEGELSDYNGDGYIEVDGALVPPKYVAATKGSIILTLANDYVSGLKEGKHDVNIYFNDKSHVSTTFTLQSEPSSKTSDTTETTTPTTTPTSTPNTTTKVTAPKTSDSVPFVVVGIVTLTAGIGSVVAYRKHKRS